MKATQPQPFNPGEATFTPGAPAFGTLVSGNLQGVGDGADHFDSDLVSATTSLASVPHALADLDATIFAASVSHDDLRHYDPGVKPLLDQALQNTQASQAAWESSLNLPSAAPPPPTAPPAPASSPPSTTPCLDAFGHPCGSAGPGYSPPPGQPPPGGPPHPTGPPGGTPGGGGHQGPGT